MIKNFSNLTVILVSFKSDEQIRKSYKKLAIKFHPDKNKSLLAEEAFKKVSHSFNVLSNKDKKANYDKHGTKEDVIPRNFRISFS